jgi:hypothetical protein
MSPILKLLKFSKSLASVLMCALVLIGPINIVTRQGQASNNSLPRSLTPSARESTGETGPQAKTADEAKRARAREAYNKLPLSFEENHGQANKKVKYVSRGAGYKLFLTETEVVLALRRSDGKQATAAAGVSGSTAAPPHRTRSGIVRVKLRGVSRTPAVTGESKMAARTNRPVGTASQKRPTDIAHYERVRYAQVYSGVDVVYSGQQRQLEYRFEVAPGADAGQIALEFGGVKRARVERQTGELGLEIVGGEIRQRKPMAYQEVGGEQREVESHYVAQGKKRVRIEVGEYDRTIPLVINPVLSYATYLRGNSQDSSTTISSDSQTPDQSQKDQPVTKPAGSGFYSISGRVMDGYGYKIEGMLVVLDGTDFNITYTDSDGHYSFDDLPAGGDYMVYPLDDNYTFFPEEYDEQYGFDNLQSDHQGADFTAHSTTLYSISGQVTRSDGSGVSLPLALYGPVSYVTYTDFYGNYSFGGLPAGDYAVSPTYSGYLNFDPEEYHFDHLQSDQTDVDFTILPGTISGSVGVAGATITLTGSGYDGDYFERTVTSGSGGTYACTDVPVPNHYITVKPTLPNYRFSPAQYTIGLLQTEATDVNFVPIPKPYAIIGVVRLGEARLPGVTVELTSPTPAGFAPRTVTTNSGGAYAFNNLPPGRRYTVTPVPGDYQFTPASKSLAPLSANHTGVDFSVKAYSLTGRITRTGTTTGIGAVTVVLTSPTPAGFAARKVQTTSTGMYTFMNLPAGRNYALKAVKSGSTFSPATRSITNLSGDIGAGSLTNFKGAGP